MTLVPFEEIPSRRPWLRGLGAMLKEPAKAVGRVAVGTVVGGVTVLATASGEIFNYLNGRLWMYGVDGLEPKYPLENPDVSHTLWLIPSIGLVGEEMLMRAAVAGGIIYGAHRALKFIPTLNEKLGLGKPTPSYKLDLR